MSFISTGLSVSKLKKRNGSIMRKLFNDEAGFIVSAELVLVLTIGVLGTVVGLASFRDAISTEMCDLASAFGAMDQTFNFRSLSKPGGTAKGHGQVFGAGYADKTDDCDCVGVMFTDVCGKPDSSTGGAVNEGNL